MECSESIELLTAALVAAQSEIEGAELDKTNPHLKNKYASLSSVIDSIRAPLGKNGLAFTQWFEGMGEGRIVITTQLAHVSGQWQRSTGSFSIGKMDAQGAAGASTYLRRYALKAMVGLTDEDDDGNAAGQKPKDPPAAAEQQQTLESKRAQCGLPKIDLYGLTKSQFLAQAADVKAILKLMGTQTISADPAMTTPEPEGDIRD